MEARGQSWVPLGDLPVFAFPCASGAMCTSTGLGTCQLSVCGTEVKVAELRRPQRLTEVVPGGLCRHVFHVVCLSLAQEHWCKASTSKWILLPFFSQEWEMRSRRLRACLGHVVSSGFVELDPCSTDSKAFLYNGIPTLNVLADIDMRSQDVGLSTQSLPFQSSFLRVPGFVERALTR